MSTAVATHLVSKTRRSDVVSALLSHRSRLSPFFKPYVKLLANLDLDECPKACIDGLQCVRAPFGVMLHQQVALLLHVCFELFRGLSVQVVQRQQRFLRGHPPSAYIRLLRKQRLAHAMQKSLSAHAFYWKRTPTRGSYAFFSTFEIRFPVPRKMIAHCMSFPPGPMVG